VFKKAFIILITVIISIPLVFGIRSAVVDRGINLPDSKLLAKIHESLENNICVPFVFAAVDDWNKPNYTLHFSVVTGMDISEDKIYVSNVYVYDEVYSVEEFLDALKFKNFENMPIFIRLGVFFGFFNRNTIYSIEKTNT
jgi:hypothetical protein